MDPLQQAIALHIGRLTLDALAAQTSFQQCARERDDAKMHLNVERVAKDRLQAELDALKAATVPPPPKARRTYVRRNKANGAAHESGATEPDTGDTGAP